MKPSHSASVWVIDQTLHVEFPSTKTEKVHEIAVPLTPEGIGFFIQIFRARNANSTVGTKGAPTKAQAERALLKAADRFLKDGGRVKRVDEKFSPELRQTARDILREMGVI